MRFITTPHTYNSWTCPTHVFGCNCPDLQTHCCNPYKDDENYCAIPEHQIGKECSDENCLSNKMNA